MQIQTAYVAVEPKKRREQGPASSVSREDLGLLETGTGATSIATGSTSREPPTTSSSSTVAPGPGPSRTNPLGFSMVSSTTGILSGKSKSSAGSMRRSRIVITVKRTEAYQEWLEDNPLHEVH